ncbi:hypothetical protein RUM44_010186 [Polyplax serrata]|uniref:Uncharacterized protein n=1 Tax=Polyplax serrata TaxID=468196 RepID=A0ABR1AWL2_POLSC
MESNEVTETERRVPSRYQVPLGDDGLPDSSAAEIKDLRSEEKLPGGKKNSNFGADESSDGCDLGRSDRQEDFFSRGWVE